MASTIEIGASPEGRQSLALKRANRHGLIAGATGTGKTVTLQVLAEAFAREGVNVFAADIKGDLSGIAVPGNPPPAWAQARAQEIGVTLTPEAQPVVFWDVYGELGNPIRTTVTDMGPTLMARVLDATEAQEGAITIAYKLADDRLNSGATQEERDSGLLLNLADLRALLTELSGNDELGKQYGLVTPQTVSVMQRRILQLEMDGAQRFFGEPALRLEDLMRPRADGRGTVNVLASERLVQSPRLYSAFLLWLMSELWEKLPEVGDPDKPKLVFFFDEAHLLFRDASKDLIQKVEQVVRLIRSKGVGIYFVTQSPTDVPDVVLAQLGNRIQHALRAYTPSDQKAVRAAAASFRANPNVDVAKEIQELKVGEALVSTLDESGAPTPVARTKVRPPNSQVGPLQLAARQAIIGDCDLGAVYKEPVDRHSAYESFTARTAEAEAEEEAPAPKRRSRAKAAPPPAPPAPPRSTGTTRRSSGSRTTAVERQTGRVASGVLNTIARELMRGILGTPSRRRR
jgi:DNA helicase HerA-like ATPase